MELLVDLRTRIERALSRLTLFAAVIRDTSQCIGSAEASAATGPNNAAVWRRVQPIVGRASPTRLRSVTLCHYGLPLSPRYQWRLGNARDGEPLRATAASSSILVQTGSNNLIAQGLYEKQRWAKENDFLSAGPLIYKSRSLLMTRLLPSLFGPL